MLCVQVSAKPCVGARDILTAWSVDNGQIWSESVAGRLVRETVDPVGCGCIFLHWLLAMNNNRSRQDTYGTYGLSSIALEVIRCIGDPWNCLYVVSFFIILGGFAGKQTIVASWADPRATQHSWTPNARRYLNNIL
jgi:hypothetical protein